MMQYESRTCTARPGIHSAGQAEYRKILRWANGRRPAGGANGAGRTSLNTKVGRIRIDEAGHRSEPAAAPEAPGRQRLTLRW
jgi:hypothetical protein